MTKEEFQKLTQNVVLLDGATGSNLMASGMRGESVRKHGSWITNWFCRIFRKLM